jgi:hypothetical protein
MNVNALVLLLTLSLVLLVDGALIMRRNQLRSLQDEERNAEIQDYIKMTANVIYDLVLSSAKNGLTEMKFMITCDGDSDNRLLQKNTDIICVLCNGDMDSMCLWGKRGYHLWEHYNDLIETYELSFDDMEHEVVQQLNRTFPDTYLRKIDAYYILSWN